MELRKATVAILLVVFWTLPSAAAPEGQRGWFKFNKAFINAHYTGGHAFTTVTAQTWGAAANAHSSSCGGNDGELHIGALETGVSLPSSQSPISGKATAADASWGLVFELPNAASGTGPATLATLTGQTVTFDGFIRVWNEGHWKGVVHPSNPHHVLEVHPARGLTAAGSSFDRKDLVTAITAALSRPLSPLGCWFRQGTAHAARGAATLRGGFLSDR